MFIRSGGDRECITVDLYRKCRRVNGSGCASEVGRGTSDSVVRSEPLAWRAGTVGYGFFVPPELIAGAVQIES